MTEPAMTIRIDGSRIHDIPSFYAELNRVFMSGETWTLGESLDAVDDLLYGGYGAVPADRSAVLIWSEHAHSRAALGPAATRAYYQHKMEHPDRFNVALARQKLRELDAGHGQSYFEIVAEIFAAHPRFTIRWE